MEFKVTDKINAKDKEIIFQGLLEYNLARLEDKNPQDLGVYLKDDNDELLAGLIGNTHGMANSWKESVIILLKDCKQVYERKRIIVMKDYDIRECSNEEILLLIN